MKRKLIAALLSVVISSTSFAAEPTKPLKGSGQSIEQKRTEIIQHIEERIANSQLEKMCVLAAQSNDELQACHEKYRPQRQQANNERRNQ